MTKKKVLYLFNCVLISIMLFACATPGTQISSTSDYIATSSRENSPASKTVEPTKSSPTSVPTSTITPEPSPTQAPTQEDLIEIWRRTIGAYTMAYAGCQFSEGILLDFNNNSWGGIIEKSTTYMLAWLFLIEIEEGLQDWEPSDDMQAHKGAALGHLETLRLTLSSWLNDELTIDETIDGISATCRALESEMGEIGDSAYQAGLTDQSLGSIILEVEEDLIEIQESMIIEDDMETPISTDIGMSRANPYPLGEMHSVTNWDIQVLESIRGDEAWEIMKEGTNTVNDPPPEGMEYLLIKMKVASTHEEDAVHTNIFWDYQLTGSNLIRYTPAAIVEKDHGLDAPINSGGEAEGWISFIVQHDEEDIILFRDEVANNLVLGEAPNLSDENRYRYFAVDDGASISIDQNLTQIQPSDLGADRSNPAAFGETVITEDWEISINEVVRGDEAWQLIQPVTSFNQPPMDGMEYVLAKVKVRYLGMSDKMEFMNFLFFYSTGSNNQMYEPPLLLVPEPDLDAALFSGGV